jgi:putative ABC transport system permease protein
MVINLSLANRAFRNVFRKLIRTLVVAVALGLAIAAIISVYTGIEASNVKTGNMIDDTKESLYTIGDLSETQERMITVSLGRGGFGGGPGGQVQSNTQTPVTENMAENISSIQNVEKVVPMINQRVGEIDDDERELMFELRQSGAGGTGGMGLDPEIFNDFFDYFIQGVPLDSELDKQYSILPSNIIAGRKITEGDSLTVMLRDELTDAEGFFAGTNVGSYIDIEGISFKIVGIYTSDDSRNNVYMSLADAQKVLNLDDGQVGTLNVYADTKAAVDLVVYDIQGQYPDYSVVSSVDQSTQFADRIQQEQERTIDALQLDQQEVANTGSLIIIISIITAVLIVLFLMLYTVKERTKEIGILKALGFPGRNIMTQFIIEGTFIGFIGGIIGVIVGIIAAPFIATFLLPETDVLATSTPSITLVLIVLIFTIALGAIGTIYPAWEASRKHPVEAIRHG